MFKPVSDNEKIRIIDLIQDIIGKIDHITEYNENELMYISMLESDDYFAEMLSFYKENKKHVKRKHSKELLEALDKIAKTINQPTITEVKK